MPFYRNGYTKLTHTERFWEKVDKSEECWIWKGAISSKGYGSMWNQGRSELATHFSWELHFGPIPDGLFVCHHCDNKPCVRPEHLFLGTQRDNMADCAKKGRLAFQKYPEQNFNRVKTHCAQGHPFNEENTIKCSRGGRLCKICQKGWYVEWLQRHSKEEKMRRHRKGEKSGLVSVSAD